MHIDSIVSQMFNKDGVVLVPDCLNNNSVKLIKEEYLLVAQTNNTYISKDEPIIVLWTHVMGEKKKILNFSEMPSLWNMIEYFIVPFLRSKLGVRVNRLQLLETVIFSKPSGISNKVQWHQDIAYYPLKPNNSISVWFPLDDVTKDRGAMLYALGSHKLGVRGSIDLHSNIPFKGEERPLIPNNPLDLGLEVKIMEMSSSDMIIQDGFTWHSSGPNTESGYNRIGITVRFITDEAVYDPRPGQGAAFTEQIDLKAGDILKSGAFPVFI